jgi:hypothetical protein
MSCCTFATPVQSEIKYIGLLSHPQLAPCLRSSPDVLTINDVAVDVMAYPASRDQREEKRFELSSSSLLFPKGSKIAIYFSLLKTWSAVLRVSVVLLIHCQYHYSFLGSELLSYSSLKVS